MPTALHPSLAIVALLLAAPGAYGAAVPRQAASLGDTPMHFEANRGQADPAVRFTAQGADYSVYLTPREAVLVLDRKADSPQDAAAVALRLRLIGSRVSPDIAGLDDLPGDASHLIGEDPLKGRTGAPTYEKVRYGEVYPGIDLIYQSNQQQLEYDFIVAPGADPGRIALDFSGADRIEIDAGGDLLLETAAGTVRQHRPIAWQESGGVRREVGSRYVRRGATRFGLQLDDYDRSLPLTIDPVIAATR
jgi:hypothetical protein